jgi:Trk K+ transport system NAD-binding subunit
VSVATPGGDLEASAFRDRSGHVIVCGLQGVGLRVVEQLHLSGTDLVVVDDSAHERFVRVLEDWGVPHLKRSAYLGDAVIDAGLAGAIAVICVEANEIHTLETALRIRELRPDIRLVVQLANPSVAGALERVAGAGTVLDVATLAGPSFVEACLRRNSHAIELGGTLFEVVEVAVTEDMSESASFRGIFGDLAPVAVMPGDGGEMTPCPGRDHRVDPGDRVAVLGTQEDLRAAGLGERQTIGTEAKVSPLTRLARRLATLWEKDNRGLTTSITALVGLLVISTVVLRTWMKLPDGKGHLSLLDSVYFTFETVATVGYGDYSFANQSSGMKVFAIFLIALGFALASIVFALFTNFLVARRIERSLGRSAVGGMTDHVVVIGLGSVGIAVVQGLVEQGKRVVVIERDGDNRYLDQARALDVPIVIADATQRETHRMVHLADASSVAVLTSADLTNIETGLAIRESLGERWEEVPVALRVFDRDLARLMERNFGFRRVRSTSAIAAPWFVGAALGLDVLSTFYVDQEPFLVGRVIVEPGGGLQGLAMGDLSSNTRVIALNRADDGTLEHPPRRGTRFAPGDRAYLLGPYEELLNVLQRNRLSQPPTDEDT